MTLTLGSLFDGIGGFPLAAIRQGITPLWASEIEPFPIFTPRVERPNQRFPTQAREPPVGEGFGGQSEQAPEGGNDSRLVKGE